MDKKPLSEDSRFPYTYCCDYIRSGVTDYDVHLGMHLPSISRGQASQCCATIALALGMTDRELAEKLATYALEKGIV